MAIVVVVFQVTAHTADVELIGEWIFSVAFTTSEFTVFPVEYELRVAGVIETGIGPAGRRVTIAAFLTAAALVMIVFRVAAEAGRRRAFKGLIFVAATAQGFPMLADQ